MNSDPLWYKDAIIYEVHVRAFQDSTSDGVGDFRGLRQRLDYLQDLGVTAIWVLPFYPSPLRDDGYDIADYETVHPMYGNLEDFQEFLEAAHRRGMRVITELVINHTSDQHPWFQRARRAPKGSPERDFYVWSDTPNKYKGVRIIFKDFERSNWTYDSVADQYYWHRFYSHQPDLNYDNPAVWDAIFPLVDYWFDMGVDGMRLDAVPYLYEREGTNCENLPETHTFLKAIRKHVDTRYPDRMFLAEANQWPEDAVAYFGDGDECHMAFHFPVMPRLFMALHQEDRFPIADILEQTPPIPENCQWCIFLRNHDELTLEMVTDEERDYMYRAYAHDPQARINLGIRRRLAPLLKNDRRRIELMNGLLFSLPGTPVLYYGDEIGMGDNIYLGDRNGVRTPMQWSADRNAGFSRANPQKLYLPIIIDPEYHYEAINVEAQQSNSSSLLWWTKRLISLRQQFQAFGRGTIEFLKPSNSKILAFIRRYNDEIIFVVANLSRFVQYVELDLSEFEGYTPDELFGRNQFPSIGELPYLLTMGPHGFYWFQLNPAAREMPPVLAAPERKILRHILVREGWEELLDPTRYYRLEPILIEFVQQSLRGQGQAAKVRKMNIQHLMRIPSTTLPMILIVVNTELSDGKLETRAVPLGVIPPEDSETLFREESNLLAEIHKDGTCVGLLFDARTHPSFCHIVLQGISQNSTFRFDSCEIRCRSYKPFAEYHSPDEATPPVTLQRGRHRNLTVVYGGRLLLKTFENLEAGPHPDIEVGRFLREQTDFDHAAPLVGSVQLIPRDGQPCTLSALFGYVPNESTAWAHTQDALSRFYEAALASPLQPPTPLPSTTWFQDEQPVLDEKYLELVNSFLRTAESLGESTAAMHIALGTARDNVDLVPEEFTKLYQRSVYQSMRNNIGMCFRTLNSEWKKLPEETQPLAQQLLDQQNTIRSLSREFLTELIDGFRIRCHSDYHLGQLLHTGNDFVIIDFEGDPNRPLSERRNKHSPLRDVATMIRSFQDAAFSALYGVDSVRGVLPGRIREYDRDQLLGWATFWTSWITGQFISSYYAKIRSEALLPSQPTQCRLFLRLLILEKAIQELQMDLQTRQDRGALPLIGILNLLNDIQLSSESQAKTAIETPTESLET